jgi:hypothetical protein
MRHSNLQSRHVYWTKKLEPPTRRETLYEGLTVVLNDASMWVGPANGEGGMEMTLKGIMDFGRKVRSKSWFLWSLTVLIGL